MDGFEYGKEILRILVMNNPNQAMDSSPHQDIGGDMEDWIVSTVEVSCNLHSRRRGYNSRDSGTVKIPPPPTPPK